MKIIFFYGISILILISCINKSDTTAKVTLTSVDSIPSIEFWHKVSERNLTPMRGYFPFEVIWKKGDSIIVYNVESNLEKKLDILFLESIKMLSKNNSFQIIFKNEYETKTIDSNYRFFDTSQVKMINLYDFVKSEFFIDPEYIFYHSIPIDKILYNKEEIDSFLKFNFQIPIQ